MKHDARPRHFRDVQTPNGREAESTASEDLFARVAALAYSFYERRGGEHGHDVEDWIQAEKSILGEAAQNRSHAR
jgi:Protein of unknown function (DUF2934)